MSHMLQSILQSILASAYGFPAVCLCAVSEHCFATNL